MDLFDKLESFFPFIFIFIWILYSVFAKFSSASKGNVQGNNTNKNPNTQALENAKRRLERMKEQASYEERLKKIARMPNYVERNEPLEEKELIEEVVKEVVVEMPSTEKTAYSNTSSSAASSYEKAYSNAFDYNSVLIETEKKMKDTQNKSENMNFSHNANSGQNEVSAMSATSRIDELMHDKSFLQKAMVISEILDKPLSLRR